MNIQKRENNQIYHPFCEEDMENYVSDFESSFDDNADDSKEFSFRNIDFSDFNGGNFKDNLKKLDHRIALFSNLNGSKSKKGNRLLKNAQQKKGQGYKIVVPSNREVIIQDVNKFILSQKPIVNQAKEIGYYKGKKLNLMTLGFDNPGALDYSINIFDPTVPLNSLYSNGIDVDNKVTVASGTTTYSNLLLYLLANPTMIVSAQINVTGSNPVNVASQLNQTMMFKNSNLAGLQALEPVNVSVTRDTMQFDSNLTTFYIMKQLGRPFVPDGLDVIQYKILAGNSVTINFYYKQVQIKRMVFEECREARNLL